MHKPNRQGILSISAGVVPVRFSPREPLFLVLLAYRNWDFPKGEIEAGEDSITAAKRELFEETGIHQVKFSWGTEYFETEPYARQKIARYFIGEVLKPNVYLRPNPRTHRIEHHAFRWLPYPKARQLMVPRLQRVIDWANTRITGHGTRHARSFAR